MSSHKKSVNRNIFLLTSPASIYSLNSNSNLLKIPQKLQEDTNEISESENLFKNSCASFKDLNYEKTRRLMMTKIETYTRKGNQTKLNLMKLSNSNSFYIENENFRLKDEHRLLSLAKRNTLNYLE